MLETVMVNFMCQFTGPRGVQTSGQTLFWVCLGGCFWIQLKPEPKD